MQQVKIRKKEKIRKMPKYKIIKFKFIIIIEIGVDQNSEKFIIITWVWTGKRLCAR